MVDANNRRNYYRILHVQPDAPTDVIKSSYRTLMLRLRQHPDLGGEHGAASLINTAYKVLVDVDRRAEYDRQQLRRSPRLADSAARRRAALDGASECPFCQHAHTRNISAESVCGGCKSPLFRVSIGADEAARHRAILRVPRHMPIRYWLNTSQMSAAPGEVSDVSLTGLGFSVDAALPLDHIIKLDSELLQAVARISHCRPAADRWQVGAAFLTLRFTRMSGAFVSVSV